MSEPTKDAPTVPWHSNPTIMSALITGAFGFIGTVTTLIISGSKPDTSSPRERPSQQRNFAARFPETSAKQLGTSEQKNLLATVGDSQQMQRFKLSQNFVYFQSFATNSKLSPSDRSDLAKNVVHQRVVWKGYVDSITPMQFPSDDASISISLVESAEKLEQAMFKTPAIFRLGKDEQEKVESLARGDFVMLTGTVSDHSLIATIVEKGHLMESTPKNGSRMSTLPSSATKR